MGFRTKHSALFFYSKKHPELRPMEPPLNCLLNNDSVTLYNVAPLIGGFPKTTSKTPDEILKDVEDLATFFQLMR